MALAEWAHQLVDGLNAGLLELGDLDDRKNVLVGHVASRVVEVNFLAIGEDTPLVHDLGYSVRNAIPCDPAEPIVVARGTIRPDARRLYLRAWPLRDQAGEVLANFPVKCRFLVWGAKRPEEATL